MNAEYEVSLLLQHLLQHPACADWLGNMQSSEAACHEPTQGSCDSRCYTPRLLASHPLHPATHQLLGQLRITTPLVHAQLFSSFLPFSFSYPVTCLPASLQHTIGTDILHPPLQLPVALTLSSCLSTSPPVLIIPL